MRRASSVRGIARPVNANAGKQARMNLFGRSKPSVAAPTPSGNSSGGNDASAAIAKLRDNQEMLQKREDHLVRKIENEIKQAKEFSARGKKREALTCIKRKKMYDKQCVGALELSRPHACSRPSRSLGRTGWTRSATPR